MNDPTDVLAQKRAETAANANPAVRPEIGYLQQSLATSEGRAFLFSMLAAAGTWDQVSSSDPEACGRRNWGAEWLAELLAANPLAVGAMWAEAMTREFEKQAKARP